MGVIGEGCTEGDAGVILSVTGGRCNRKGLVWCALSVTGGRCDRKGLVWCALSVTGEV